VRTELPGIDAEHAVAGSELRDSRADFDDLSSDVTSEDWSLRLADTCDESGEEGLTRAECDIGPAHCCRADLDEDFVALGNRTVHHFEA
jgi:hypothetical protein